jgi:hypothetical protein
VTPVPAGAGGEAAIRLVSQDAWTAVGGELHLSLAIDGAAAGNTVSFVAHSSVASREEFDRSLGEDGLGSVIDQVTVPIEFVPASASGSRPVTLGLEVSGGPRLAEKLGARRAGVFPLEIELLDPDEQSLARVVTYIVVAAPAGSSDAVSDPLGVAWVWPLAAAPALRPNGEPDPAIVRQLRSRGRIGRQAVALERAAGVPLTVVPSPETLESWSLLAQHNDALVPGIDALRQALTTTQFLGTTYVPVDLPSLLASGMPSAVDAQLLVGADTLGGFFGARIDPRTALARPVDDRTVDRLQTASVDRFVVDGTALADHTDNETIGHPFALGTSTGASAVAADRDLTNLLTGDADPAVRAQRFLAGLAVVAFESPDEARAVTAVNTPDFDPPARLLDAVLTGLRGNPLLRPMTVANVFEQIEPATTDDGNPISRALAPYLPPGTPVAASAYASAQTKLDTFEAFAPDAPGLNVARHALLSSVSSAWSGAAGAAEARAQLAGATAVADGFLSRIHVPTKSTITLTSRSGDIPITFRNSTGQKVDVLVQLASAKLSFPDGAQQLITLKPKSTTVRFEVVARTSGSFPLRVTLRSGDGSLLIGQADFRVEATAVSAAGLFLIIGAAVFLLLWWLVHYRRERARRHAAKAIPVT